MIHGVNDAQVGRAFRAVRIRKGWRQEDVAREAGVSQQTVSRIERGLLDRLPPGTLRRVASALGIRVTIEARWDGAELDRLLGARHSAMHEEVARLLGGLPEWLTAPEVTFAVYGERGAIDILAWHAGTRTLLVIELKTELVDVQETLGTLDRSSKALESVLGRMERGEGTLGKLSKDDALYNNALEATQNLSKSSDELRKLVADLQANPKKYINLKIF